MKFIILDRDGVINHDSDNFIKTIDEWVPIPGSIEAIARLKENNFKIAVVTNQSGIARNYYKKSTLFAMHDKFRRLLANEGAKVDAIFFCPHGPNDACSCRKPATAMYRNAEKLLNTSLKNSYTVGDSYRDLEAAITVQSKPILVKTGKGEKTLREKYRELESKQIPVYDNLTSFVDNLLK